MMNQRISSLLIATSLLVINATSAQAGEKDVKLTDAQAQKQLVAAPGDWCFELPWMGLFCYEL